MIGLKVTVNCAAMLHGVEGEYPVGFVDPEQNAIVAGAELLDALEVLLHMPERSANCSRVGSGFPNFFVNSLLDLPVQLSEVTFEGFQEFDAERAVCHMRSTTRRGDVRDKLLLRN